MARIAGTSTTKDQANTSSIKSIPVYMNDGVRICSEACSCCWDTPLPDDYEGKVVYLGKRAKIGHTSIFEHSLLDTVIIASESTMRNYAKDLVNFLENMRYLKFCHRTKSNGDSVILIGGSWRGYIDLYKRMYENIDLDNPFLRALTPSLWSTCDHRIFYELINEGIIDDFFDNTVPDPMDAIYNPQKIVYEDDKIKIAGCDDLIQLRKNIFTIVGEDLFGYEDLAPFATISVLFKNMSRTCTHQLVRHRNAITQESQRYVDYSDAAFADPCDFKPEKYDKNKVYDIEFGGSHFSMTSEEAGEAIIKIYDCFRDQGMLKEDARSFLPGNVKCRKIYMTFTYETLLKFFELRTDPHAQAEIRSFALDLQSAMTPIIESLKDEKNKTISVDETFMLDEKVLINTITESEDKKND